MHLPIKSDKFIFTIVFSVLALVHVLLLNVHATEWGDSYRILRAAQILRTTHVYPADEKRPPLLSAIIATNPLQLDLVLWGKIILLLFSLGFFVLYSRFLQLYAIDKKTSYIASFFLSISPVFFYWSLRIYADIPLAFFALLALYIFKKYENSLNAQVLFILGIVSGLAILTRFEGYLLFAAILFGVFVKKFSKSHIFILGFLLLAVPFWYFRSPFASSYLAEPGARVYDLKMVFIYIVSALFLYGNVFATYFLFTKKTLIVFFKEPALFAFFCLEMALILVWPAAIPRLFVAVAFIPLIFIVNNIKRVEQFTYKDYVSCGLLFILYVITQFTVRLQFLVPLKNLLILSIVSQLFLFFLLMFKRYNYFVIASILASMVWSLSVIYTHTNILRSVKEAAVYAETHLTGLVGYNDVSAVTDWYTNYASVNGVDGEYYDMNSKESKSFEALRARGYTYLLISNEHNPDFVFDLASRPYLEQIAEFRYNTLGTEFWTKVVKVKHEYK